VTFRAIVRHALREARGSARPLVFFILCLAVGVGALVAVRGTSTAIDAGVRAHARELLGADAVVQAWRPLPELDDELQGTGVAIAQVKEMVTLVASGNGTPPGRSQVVELRAVGPNYPFYGPPRLSPDRPLAALLAPDATVVADQLLERLGLRVGDILKIGGQDFRIAGTVLSEADTVSGSLRIGPRVFVSLDGLARTTLETFGSRILRRALLGLPPGHDATASETLVERLRARFKDRDDLRIETYRDVQPAVKRTIERMEPFLALVALVSLLLGGIGVGQGMRIWIRGRLDAIAVLRALGARPREVLLLYLVQSVALTLIGGALGVLIGLAVPPLLPLLLRDALPPGILRLQMLGPAVYGMGAGLVVSLIFVLNPLLSVWRVPTLRVLRRDAEPLPFARGPRIVGFTAVALAVAGTATVLAGSLVRGTVFAGALAVVLLILAGAARLLARAAGALARRSTRVSVRYGAAALARPGADTSFGVLALGLGLTVVVALAVVERHLTLDLNRDLPQDAPTAFFIDIQTDQWPRVEAMLGEAGATNLDSVPVVTGRLRAVDGRPAMEIARERAPDRRWSLTREQRLTYMATLPKGNTLVAGQLWSDPAHDEVSLEREFAESLGVRLGSTLTFDIQGLPLDLRVTSLRRVDWRTFGINFFAIVEPGVLDAAPQVRLAAARLPQALEQTTQDRLAAAFPNVTVIFIREVLEKVSALVRRLATGVRVLGVFTFAAGLGILAAAFHVAADRRRREVALLKTLGFTRGQILGTFAFEQLLVGLTAGLIGTGAGVLLGWVVVRHVLDLPWMGSWKISIAATLTTVAVTIVTSLVATRGALQTRPSETLRSGD
jgi:putative ABC transport system permease protein